MHSHNSLIGTPIVQRAALTLLLVCAAALPFMVTEYRLFQLTMVLIYAVALLGLNLLTGYTGQISLGHGAFFALGAYATAILMDKIQLPYWLALPAAAVVCGLAGFLFGLPAIRLAGHYLALATFALAVALPQLLKHKQLEFLTGGIQGLIVNKPDPPVKSLIGLELTADRWLYLLTLAITAIMFWAGWNLVRGRMGRAMVAVRDHAPAAASMGIHVAGVKGAVFGISALYTGLAGGLSALAVSFIAPDSFTAFLSITLLVGIVVGGVSTIQGAIYGAVFIQFVPAFTDSISKAAPWAIYGLVLLALMFVMPAGIAGTLRKLASWLHLRRL